MRDGNHQFGSHQRGGHGRVHVTHDDDEIGPILQADLFEGDHDLRRLHGVGARTDAEIVIGCRQLQLSEESTGHRGVVVLAGVHQHLADARVAAQRLHHRRDFHVIRPGANHVDDGLLTGHKQSSRPSTHDACHRTAFITVHNGKLTLCRPAI